MHGDRSLPAWEGCVSLYPSWWNSSGEASAGELSYLWGLFIGFCPQTSPSYDQKSCVLASSPRGRGKHVKFMILGRKKLFNYFSVDCYLIVVDTYNIIALYFKRLVFYVLFNYVFKCDKIILAFESLNGLVLFRWRPSFSFLNGSSIRYINWLHSD